MDATDGSWSLHAVSRQTSSNQKKKNRKTEEFVTTRWQTVTHSIAMQSFSIASERGRGRGRARRHRGGGPWTPSMIYGPRSAPLLSSHAGVALLVPTVTAVPVQCSRPVLQSKPLAGPKCSSFYFPCISLSHFRQNVRHRCR